MFNTRLAKTEEYVRALVGKTLLLEIGHPHTGKSRVVTGLIHGIDIVYTNDKDEANCMHIFLSNLGLSYVHLDNPRSDISTLTIRITAKNFDALLNFNEIDADYPNHANKKASCLLLK
jgi:hypothetical protein